jgi:1-hydroxycarotenoid 3,4-desaturase
LRDKHVAVIGAGAGGLAAALTLAARGLRVTVLERAAAPGGKMREAAAGGARIDAGPTVFTMRWVLDELFEQAGARLSEHLQLRPAEVLARHAWSADQRLDLFADPARSEEAIGAFAGAAEARRYRAFRERARRIYATLEGPFLRAAEPSALGLVRGAGLRGLSGLWRISPFATLWKALGEHFHDPRLRQLFGRYSTYCGASPFSAPATLMLVAHVEQDGVWLVEGGMHRIAQALAQLAAHHGAQLRYGAHVSEVLVERGAAAGVRLADGERIDADLVICNADASALGGGLLGAAARAAVEPVPPAARSLSALTWVLLARTRGFPLRRHTVFFSADYPAEFDAIFRAGRLPAQPTVYVCAQDRGDDDTSPPGPERLLCLVNAPPVGDRRRFEAREIEACEQAAFGLMQRCGLTVERDPARTVITTPAEFDALFPGTGGALYGRASHGWQASFQRPGVRSRIPGLYLAGGSVHPGPGVPMAALSGRLAAQAVLQDLAGARAA